MILDEPINGLAPQGIVDIRNVLIRLNREKGITILISSHILGELSKMATHYGIIKDGTMVKEISAEELSLESKDYLCVKVNNVTEAYTALHGRLGAEIEIVGNELHIIGVKDGAKVNKILSENNIVADEISSHRLDLEEYFMKLTGGLQ